MYDCDVPPSLAAAVPALATLCPHGVPANHIFPHVKPVTNRSVTLTSVGGTDFLSFAKGASFKNGKTQTHVHCDGQDSLVVLTSNNFFWVTCRDILYRNNDAAKW